MKTKTTDSPTLIHRPDVDQVSIDFRDDVEAKSFYQDGLIIREDKKGNVIGIDITDSSKFFAGSDLLTLKEASTLLGVSESTIRRKAKAGQIKFQKPNGKDYRFKKSEILKHIPQSAAKSDQKLQPETETPKSFNQSRTR